VTHPSTAEAPAHAREPDGRWRRRRTRSTIIFAAAVLSIIAIGWLDFVTGPALGFSLFYLVPIVACAWWAGERLAVIAAALAALNWLLADMPFRLSEHLAIPVWNAVTRSAIFVSVALLVARTRRNTRELQGLNERLGRMLAEESALARTDQLTGLPNARAFREALAAGVARSRRSDEPTRSTRCWPPPTPRCTRPRPGARARSRLAGPPPGGRRASLVPRPKYITP
jgi:K+-sensing histidine kinase KdpD